MFSRPFRDLLVFVEPTQEYALGLPLLSQNLHDMLVGTRGTGVFCLNAPQFVFGQKNAGAKAQVYFERLRHD
jgi:hypothetical protein